MRSVVAGLILLALPWAALAEPLGSAGEEMHRLLATLGGTRDPQRLREVERSAVELALRNPDVDRRADAVIAAYRAAPETAKFSLVRILGGIANGPAYEFLKDIVREGGPQSETEAALRTLVAWPDTRATALLINQARRMNAADPRRAVVVRGALAQMRKATAELARRPDLKPPAALVEWFVKTEQLMRIADEKRTWLTGLAELRHREAIRLVGLYLDDPEVASGAGTAAVKIAMNLSEGEHRPDAIGLLEAVAATSKDPSIRAEAKAALAKIGR